MVIKKISWQAIAIWLAFAACTGIITYLMYRKKTITASTAIILPMLVFYLAFTLTITIIERASRDNANYKMELFWTIRAILTGKKYLKRQILWNVLLFVPIGLGVSTMMKRQSWIAIVMGAMFSTALEILQLMTHRGLFEWDDIVYNTIGALIGFLLYLILKRLKNKMEG